MVMKNVIHVEILFYVIHVEILCYETHIIQTHLLNSACMKVCYEGYPNLQFCSHSGSLCFLHVSINDNWIIFYFL